MILFVFIGTKAPCKVSFNCLGPYSKILRKHFRTKISGKRWIGWETVIAIIAAWSQTPGKPLTLVMISPITWTQWNHDDTVTALTQVRIKGVLGPGDTPSRRNRHQWAKRTILSMHQVRSKSQVTSPTYVNSVCPYHLSAPAWPPLDLGSGGPPPSSTPFICALSRTYSPSYRCIFHEEKFGLR